MRFFLDQDVYVVTAHLLTELGHDVLTAAGVGCSRASDEELLRRAIEDERIFVTRDRDFGNLVFIRNVGTGVIYLRFPPSALQAGHRELEHVLRSYSESDFQHSFVVVEPGRHRFRKLS